MVTEKEASDLIDEYTKWIRDNTILRTVSSGWTEINTPFLDRHNDGIQIYVRKIGDKLELTDDGYTLSDLEISGCELRTDRQRSFLNKILNSNDITNREGKLSMTFGSREFPARKLEFITALQQIGDLYITSRNNVYSLFSDEVALWFESKNRYPIRYHSVSGIDGAKYNIDFIFPKKGRDSLETALQAIGNPDRNVVSYHTLMKRELTRDIDIYLILRDEDIGDRKFREMQSIAKTGDVELIRWSEKDDYIDTFA